MRESEEITRVMKKRVLLRSPEQAASASAL
jgi:hypothetical protein